MSAELEISLRKAKELLAEVWQHFEDEAYAEWNRNNILFAIGHINEAQDAYLRKCDS
jgi:hypothetical protein